MKGRAVYIVEGTRTPFLKAQGRPGLFSGSDLMVQAARALLKRQTFPLDAIEEVIVGCAMPGPDEANIARVVALRLGLPQKTPAWTVMRNCASGLQAIDSALQSIQLGRCDVVLAGGTDAMSHTPLLFNPDMVRWFAALNQKGSVFQKIKTVLTFRPRLLAPVIALERGLRDPIACINMGQTAEEVAYRFDISREAMDRYAVESHQRLGEALAQHALTEIVPLYSPDGRVFLQDDGLRADSSVEKLANLKPFFDKKFGRVTPGNSSQITDGAACVLLASERAVEQYGLSVLAKIQDVAWVGLDPKIMGMGPSYAIDQILARQKLLFNQIDYWEINEAFAAQVLGCCVALDQSAFCEKELGRKNTWGAIARDRLNIHGGAIAIGHPIGASGARIVLRLAHILNQNNARYGVASLCIGGGQGGAILLEKV